MLVLLAGLILFGGGGLAQETPTVKNKRTVYLVKHGAAKDLALLLGKHFKGDAEIQALPDSASNFLLISAAPAVFEEVVKLLEQLDRQPGTVVIELFIAEIATKKGQDNKPPPADVTLDEKEFTGAAKDVLAKVESLKKAGRFSSLRQTQLTAVENQPASVLINETKPTVVGMHTTATGLVSRNITYRNVGTSAAVTVRVPEQKTVIVELNLKDSRLHVPETGIPIGKDENGVPVRAAETINSSLQAQLRVPSGQALAAQGVKTESKSGQAQILVVVAARVLGPD
jgi:type II secretory pathway component GspD/PulD (secretin)